MAERNLRLLDRGDLLDQARPDRRVRQHARARVAGLALVVEDAPGDRFRSGVEIGVGHDDMRRFSAAFESDALHVAYARVDHHQLADFGRAGEGDHVDVGMERQRLARLLAETRHDVEDAVGQSGFLGERPEEERCERRLLGGLQDHRIAGDERRADLPCRDDQGIVPRHDRGDDAERRPADRGDVVRAERRDLVVQLVGEFRVILDAVGAGGDIDAEGIQDHLADVERLKKREFVGVVADEFGEAEQRRLLHERVGVAPDAALECASGGADGPVDVSLAAIGDMGEDPAVDRREAGEGCAIERLDIGAADEGPPLDLERGGAGEPAFACIRTIEHGVSRRESASSDDHGRRMAREKPNFPYDGMPNGHRRLRSTA